MLALIENIIEIRKGKAIFQGSSIYDRMNGNNKYGAFAGDHSTISDDDGRFKSSKSNINNHLHTIAFRKYETISISLYFPS